MAAVTLDEVDRSATAWERTSARLDCLDLSRLVMTSATRFVTMRRTARAALILGILIGLMPLTARAADKDNPAWLLPMPEVDADPKVPALKQAVGHGWAEEISSHSEIERYLRALTDAAPDRTRLLRYGETIEKRGLYVLVITSAKNLRASMRSAWATSGSPIHGRPRPKSHCACRLDSRDRLDGIWSARRRDFLERRRTTDGLSPPGRSASHQLGPCSRTSSS